METIAVLHKTISCLSTAYQQMMRLKEVQIVKIVIPAFKSIYTFFASLLNGAKNLPKRTYEKIQRGIKFSVDESVSEHSKPDKRTKIEKLRNLAHGFFSLQLFKLTPLLAPLLLIPAHFTSLLFIVDIAALFGSYYKGKADYHEIKLAKEPLPKWMYTTNLTGSVLFSVSSILHLVQFIFTSSKALLLLKATALCFSLAATPFFLISTGLYLWIHRDYFMDKWTHLRQAVANKLLSYPI